MIACIFAALAFGLLQNVVGLGVALQERAGCNADNCLRALQHNGAPASAFCSEVLTLSITPSVTFTHPCTENPTAVATACSCLLAETHPPTPTPTFAQCGAANNYGWVLDGGDFRGKSAVVFFSQPSITKRGDCCNYCFNDPGCYSYYEGEINGGGYFCEIGFITGNVQPIGPNVSSKCPQGTYYWSGAGTAVYVPPATEGAGLGPCGATS